MLDNSTEPKLEAVDDQPERPVEVRKVRTVTIGLPSRTCDVKVVDVRESPQATNRKRSWSGVNSSANQEPSGDGGKGGRQVRVCIVKNGPNGQVTGKGAIQRTVTIKPPTLERATAKSSSISPVAKPSPAVSVDNSSSGCPQLSPVPSTSSSGRIPRKTRKSDESRNSLAAFPFALSYAGSTTSVPDEVVLQLCPSKISCNVCGVPLAHRPYPGYVLISTAKQTCPKSFNELLFAVEDKKQRMAIAKVFMDHLNKRENLRICAYHFASDVSGMGDVKIGEPITRIYMPSPRYPVSLDPHCALCGSTENLAAKVMPRPLPIVLSSDAMHGSNIPGLREGLMDMMRGLLQQFDYFGHANCCLVCCDADVLKGAKSLSVQLVLAARTKRAVATLREAGLL